MEVVSASSYPRPEWFRKYLRKAGLQKDVEYSVDDRVLKKAQLEVLEKQKTCGVDISTDGLLTWHDFLASMAIRAGFKPGKLVRYFENNLYYRMPELKKVEDLKKPELKEFKSLCEVLKPLKKPLKAVISCVTPFYLSSCRDVKVFRIFAELVLEEVADLFNYTSHVQFDEPSFAYSNEFVEEFLSLLESFNFKGNLWISVYFKEVPEKLYPSLVDSFDVVFLDFVEGFEGNLKNVEQYGCSKLCAGIADGRNTKLDFEMGNKVERISEFCKVEYVSSNTGLEFLPESKAYEKMKTLSKLRDTL